MDTFKIIALIVKFSAKAIASFKDGKISPEEAADLATMGYKILDEVMDLAHKHPTN